MRVPLLALLLLPWQAWACSGCRSIVLANVFDGHFAARMLLLLLPVLLLVGIALWIHFAPAPGGSRAR